MRYFRRVIKVDAEMSPNVRAARQLLALNPNISREELSRRSQIFPGILTWDELQERRATWDPMRQAVGLDAMFWKGPELLMFPPEWLDRAAQRAAELGDGINRKGGRRTLGCDPAEGGDDTAWAVADELGLLELIAMKTSDTSQITGITLGLMRKWNIRPEDVIFDRGGGGKEHADRLRSQGYNVRTVAFGETVMLEPKRGMTFFEERKEIVEDRTIFKNRRAEMYWGLRLKVSPAGKGFGLPAKYPELRRQLAPIKIIYSNGEGKLELPPKNKKDQADKRETMTQMIGCSPDESDAVVMAVWALDNRPVRRMAGVA